MYPFRQESDVKPQTLQVFTFCLNIFTAKYNLKYIKYILNDGKWSYLFSFLNGYYFYKHPCCNNILSKRLFGLKFPPLHPSRHASYVKPQILRMVWFYFKYFFCKYNWINMKYSSNHGKFFFLFFMLNGYYFYKHFSCKNV